MFLLQSCTVYSPPRARMILLQPTAVHVTPLLKNPPVASITHCVKSKILTMTSKAQHRPSFGSFIYLISCPSSPHSFYCSPLPSSVSLRFSKHTAHPLPNLCFCYPLSQECFLHLSPGIFEVHSLLHSNLCSSVTASK